MSDHRCEIRSVPSLKEVIQTVSPRRFTAAVLDLSMFIDSAEEMNALDTISIIKGIDAQLPIIAITEDSSLSTEREARLKGVFYYLVKPVDPEEVRAAVTGAIFKHSRETAIYL